jgi:hypothetical protein
MERNSIVIQDSRFKLSLSFRRITKSKVSGHIGPIGTYASNFGANVESVRGLDIAGLDIVFNSPVKFHHYRKQITEDVYEEIQIEGLTLKYHIFDGYYETADEDEDILLIPVDTDIANTYPISVREVLYTRSLHYVFNSRVVQKIKWYQRGAFKILMMIVSIIITIYTAGAGSGLVGLAANMGANAGINALVVQILIQIAIQIAISYAVKLFVKLVGVKVAFIVALVALFVGGYQMITSGGTLPIAQDLVSLSTNLASAASAQLQKDFNALNAEYEQFADYVKSEQEKLEEARNKLDYNNYLEPMIIFGETPSEFYDRTVHSGNIGIISLDAIPNYVDIALQLPKFNEPIGA